MRKIIFLCFIVLSIATIKSYAVMHLDGKTPGPADYTRPIEKPKLTAQTTKTVVKKVIALPTGAKNIAVILVDFTSAGDNTTDGVFQFSVADIIGVNTTIDYLKGFYTEASYGALTLNFAYFYSAGSSTILTGTEIPFTLSNSLSYYGTDDTRNESIGLTRLLTDSLNKAPLSLSSTTYDAVIVLHAGYGNESTDDDLHKGDIWSAVAQISPAVNGFNDGALLPAREGGGASPIGVTCHEFGHILGFPDLYNTTTGNSKVGDWCLMDHGTWITAGANPAPPSAWCKKLIGWLSSTEITQPQEISGILPIEASANSIYKIPILGSSSEYFLVNYSSKSLYNVTPPGEGVAIWHIDEGTIDGTTLQTRLSNNSINNLSHNTVDIVQADNSHPHNPPYGDSSDLWPGTRGIFTSPYSNSYSDAISGITIANFAFLAGKASFYTTQLQVAERSEITKVISYPNPSGAGYYHPKESQGILATISMNFSRPPQDISIAIYNLNGELVKLESGFAKMNFNVSATSDFNFVYEYDWNGKNNSGQDVAPGLYIYRVKTDSQMKFGKLAVVR